MRLTPWPRSLFGQLLVASVAAVLVAQAIAVLLLAREHARFVLQGSVREWARRIAETTLSLEPLAPEARAARISGLLAGEGTQGPPSAAASPASPHVLLAPGPPSLPGPPGMGLHRPPEHAFLPLPPPAGFAAALREQLEGTLGRGYTISVVPTPAVAPAAIAVPAPFFEAHALAQSPRSVQRYDVHVRFPDGDAVAFRVLRPPGGAPLPRNLFFNLMLLVLLLVLVLYATARSITRPLSDLARAADRVGRELRPPRLPERGARELRDAARAFNTMHERLSRYLDSRTRVLAAMSHDLKTPLTRLRLQVETLEDAPLQQRMGRELDEMESMVHEALSLFRGLDDGAPPAPIDVDALLGQLREEFTRMGATVTVSGQAPRPYTGRVQALKRCLTNLVANAVAFGGRADLVLEDGAELVIRVRDAGPGLPAAELERVFEPFYRLESSRNRASGGTGLGLTIARDVAQAHGGSLTLANLAGGGLEATLRLPRRG